MKPFAQRRAIALLLAAMLVNGGWLHVAMLPASAGSLPVEEAKPRNQSYFNTLHAGCVAGLKCSLCVFSASDNAALDPVSETLDRAVTPVPGPTLQGDPVFASALRGVSIRAPPHLSHRS